MVNLLRAARQPRVATRYSDGRDDWHVFNGNQYWNNVLTEWEPGREGIGSDFPALVNRAYKGNAVVAACELTRMALVSEARPQWRNRDRGNLYGTTDLGVLETPWPGGTFRQLAARMVLNADMAGTAFVARRAERPDRLMLLRPDWVQMVLGSEMDPDEARFAMDADLLGALYYPGGRGSGRDPVPLLADELAVWAPQPDPLAAYRGVSWMTAAGREIDADVAASTHKLAFFENGATPQLVISFGPEVKQDQFQNWVRRFEMRHGGVSNAYKTLAIGAGANVIPIGKDLQQLDFKVTQGAGEPLALNTPIPTPAGWTTMADLKVGDQVIGRDGRPANVVGVSPVHVDRECFRVVLKDRTSIVADASHLWVATDRNSAKRAERQYTTRELYDLFVAPYSNGVGGHRLALPATPVVELDPIDLLVDPYVLGAWLGDGQTAGAAVCGEREDLKFVAAEFESRGYVTSRWSTAPDKVDVIGVPGGLLAALRALGVLGDKRIPGPYLRASVEQRLDLLRGLMDTDGTVDVRGGCEFSSKYEALARQVADLVRSLGYRATLSRKADARSRTDWTWRLHFRVAQDRIPFLLPRKVDRCLTAGDPHVRDAKSIVSIEPVASVPVRCIAVDTPDRLFLAGEGFVPTHNTRIAAASGVHPVVAALSEGMAGSSLNAGNFRAACRLVADRTLRPLWGGLFAALETIVPPPDGRSHLWYPEKEISFLQEDRKDAAEIGLIKAQTITAYVRDGFTAESAAAAVEGEDTSLLVHSGLVSVQLQPPGSKTIDGSTAQPAIGA